MVGHHPFFAQVFLVLFKGLLYKLSYIKEIFQDQLSYTSPENRPNCPLEREEKDLDYVKKLFREPVPKNRSKEQFLAPQRGLKTDSWQIRIFAPESALKRLR